MRNLLFLIILPFVLFAQETIKPELTDPRIPDLIDTAIAPIPGEDTLQQVQDSVAQSFKNDTTAERSDSSEAPEELIPIENGFLIGARWAFSNSEVFQGWVTQQKTFKTDMDQYFKDRGYKYTSSWLREPDGQSITFPFTLGYFHSFNKTVAMNAGVSYAFRFQRSVFLIEEDSTDVILFENNARVTHQQAEIHAGVQYRFNKEYFSVTGVDETGIEAGIGFIPFSMFAVNSSSTDPNQNRRAFSHGIGATWLLGVFTEKQFSQSLLMKFFFNYHGSYHYGFENRDELFNLGSPSEWEYKNHDFVESFFQLGASFIINRSNTKDENDEER